MGRGRPRVAEDKSSTPCVRRSSRVSCLPNATCNSADAAGDARLPLACGVRTVSAVVTVSLERCRSAVECDELFHFPEQAVHVLRERRVVTCHANSLDRHLVWHSRTTILKKKRMLGTAMKINEKDYIKNETNPLNAPQQSFWQLSSLHPPVCGTGQCTANDMLP